MTQHRMMAQACIPLALSGVALTLRIGAVLTACYPDPITPPQEFREGRKGNPSSPQVLFSHKEPPAEVANMPGALTGDNVGYITFVLFPRHLDPKNCENTIDLIHQFRDYLHYHLKCCKAYLHTRMRARSAALLKILNRAKPENENKQRKTISGRSFVRK